MQKLIKCFTLLMQVSTLSRTEKLSTITHCGFNARLISLWLYKFRSPHTRRAYETDIREFLTFINDRPLNQVTFEDLQQLDEAVATGKEGKPRSNSSMNRKMGALRSLLTGIGRLMQLNLEKSFWKGI